jgi:D-alanyl-D-alanine carboxypeptidase/D-alanyl-D-alanine-endopeptidase (penicillin-binding protein 4)
MARALALALLLLGNQDAEAQIRTSLRRHKIAVDKTGIAVYSITRSRTLLEINPQALLLPASCIKAATTAAALDQLGPDFRFTTRLYALGEVRGGELHGDLAVFAGGDPNISGRDHDGDPAFLFKTWAQKLLAKGIKRVTGDLRLVNSVYDTEFVHPEWREHDPTRWWTAPVAAFSLNDNCVDLILGGDARVSMSPQTRYVSVVNRLKAVAKPEEPILITRRGAEITVAGEISPRGQRTENCAVENPQQFFGSVLLETLQSAGIAVAGKLVQVDEQVVPAPKGEPIDVFTSGLGRTIEICNSRSQNFYAEMIFKQLGYRKTGYGTFNSGRDAVAAFLKKLDVADARIRDGSGLSKENRLTADALVKILVSMKDTKEFVDSLPVAGQSGTLEKRMKKLHGRVRAKTGHLKGVNALAGYLTAASEDKLAFAILMNDPDSSNAAMDEICELLHGSF